MNLILGFAVSLTHRLRYEPYTHYEDLNGLIDHLDTFARAAEGGSTRSARMRASNLKRFGQRLNVSFAQSNPRKEIKKATKPLGNLPLEILLYISAYVERIMQEDLLKMRYQSLIRKYTIYY